MMTVWERRDLPVLTALADCDDHHFKLGYLTLTGDDATPLGLNLDPDELYDSILTLGDAGYVEGRPLLETSPSASFTHFHVTGRGLQALDRWPRFVETMSPLTLAALLERLADEAPTPEESEKARRAAAYLRKVGETAFRAATTSTAVQLARLALGLP